MCSTANVGNPPHRESFSLDLGMPPRDKGGSLKKGLDGGKPD
jgi:hypothetical protein